MSDFIKEMKGKFLELARKEILKGEPIEGEPVNLQILGELVTRFLIDLSESVKSEMKTVDENEVWKWFNYMLHKGIAAAIATRYYRDDFELTYAFEEACNGKHLSYKLTLQPVENEYSFNIRYNLNRMSMAFENYFNDIYDYLKEQKEVIHNEGITIEQILKNVLIFGCLAGTEFIARIPLTTDDYWPIRNQLIFHDDLFEDDEDIRYIEQCDMRPEFDEHLTEDEDYYSVCCPFCGEEALLLPKSEDMWRDQTFEPCEHFAFAFISNTTAHVYGRNYYKQSFRRQLINYVETYKGVTCEQNYEGFLNDVLNGNNQYLDISEIPTIIKLVKSDLPDCTIVPKYFTIPVNNKQHAFTFHFMKFDKPGKN